MEKQTVLQPVLNQLTEFLAMPSGIEKNIVYYRSIISNQFNDSNLFERDGFTYYSYSQFNINRNGDAYYIKRKKKYGFTMNPKGKIQIWFGNSILEIPGLVALYNHFNLNWLDIKMQPFITKSILEKILTGKITNNLDIMKTYIKVMRLKVNATLWLKYVLKNNIPKHETMRYMQVAIDANHLLKYLIDENTTNYNIQDMINQALILNYKINFKWSKKRMEEEHKKWTQQIMEVELNSIDDTIVEWVQPLHKHMPNGFTLLDTQRKVFIEGKTMNHCVYTNYWGKIQNGSYIIYHVQLPGTDEEVTVGYERSFNPMVEFKYHQMQAKHCKPVSDQIREYIRVAIQPLNKRINKLQFPVTKELIYEPIELVF